MALRLDEIVARFGGEIVGAGDTAISRICPLENAGPGDLAFFYDSNALWNQYLSTNLKIIVINNGGGNIFRIIPGPSNMPQFEEFIETRQEASISFLTQSFGLKHYFCDSLDGLKNILPIFYEAHETACVLEIKTDPNYSAEALKNYFTYIRKQYEQESLADD